MSELSQEQGSPGEHFTSSDSRNHPSRRQFLSGLAAAFATATFRPPAEAVQGTAGAKLAEAGTDDAMTTVKAAWDLGAQRSTSLPSASFSLDLYTGNSEIADSIVRPQNFSMEGLRQLRLGVLRELHSHGEPVQLSQRTTLQVRREEEENLFIIEVREYNGDNLTNFFSKFSVDGLSGEIRSGSRFTIDLHLIEAKTVLDDVELQKKKAELYIDPFNRSLPPVSRSGEDRLNLLDRLPINAVLEVPGHYLALIFRDSDNHNWNIVLRNYQGEVIGRYAVDNQSGAVCIGNTLSLDHILTRLEQVCSSRIAAA